MHDILKVLNKAVNKNGGIFAHLCIDDGVVEANNGRISILAHIPELAGIRATVPADKFMAAIRACKGPVDINTTDSNLMVKSGSFSARIALNLQEFPRMVYDGGQAVDVPQGFIDKLAIAQTFATTEAFNGVLLRGAKVYGVANYGAVALEGVEVPCDIVIPTDTVADMVSIKEQPTGIRVSGEYAIIEYASFKLRTALVDKRWPDAEAQLRFDTSALPPIEQVTRDALDVVLPFADDKSKRVKFTGEALKSGDATVDGITVPRGNFNGEQLANAFKHADRMGITYVVSDGKEFAVGQFTGPGVVAVLAGMV